MNSTQYIKGLIIVLILFITGKGAMACSMYKITLGGKTIVGCNEDAWRITPHVWFETSKGSNQIGAGFTGSRFDGGNGYAPQSGMNEAGLCFSRLATITMDSNSNQIKKGKPIENEVAYLKDILHTCKSIKDVKEYISQYDHSFFNGDVFIYIDSTGDYLVVEPYILISGNEATYLLSNFCPSVTDEAKACKLDRYRQGGELLKQSVDISLAFCTALSDTMHVCREKWGDGTLLTSIWNLQEGTFNLFFYHRYDSTIQFNLKEELAKGNHSIAIQTLFPHNKEFENLANFQTPQNNDKVRMLLVVFGVLFFACGLYFPFHYFFSNQTYQLLKVIVASFNFLMAFYMYVLATHVYIFYFPSPYLDPQSMLISLSSYIPFVALFALIPFLYFNVKVIRENVWQFSTTILFACINLMNLISIGLFFYWKLFDVFH